ncbi:MAG: alpha/beta hydrolase [Tistlia sp.]|uniref:alpha/beta fold hydrolase n=1 Tax=Tistlia sp. TaxID=3057121 RepID=UPI0034A29568
MSTQVIEGLAVEVEGAGDPVLFVHGLGGTSNSWTPQVMALAGRYRMIRPDLPGSGRSPLGGGAGAKLTIESLVETLEKLLGVLGAGRAHLVGHSMGTILCQHLAARRPSLVRSLALFGAFPEPPEAARAALEERGAKARREGMAEIAEATLQAGTAAATRSDNPVAAAFVRESLMRQPGEGYGATCEALAGARAADLSLIGCPVLLVTGDEDKVAPPATLRALDSALKDSRATVLSRCGHWTPIEKAAECSRELGDFLARAR